MKLMKRNSRMFWYRLALGEGEPIVDDDGFTTGEGNITYGAPVAMMACINPAEGRVWSEEYGLREDYDKLLIIEDMNCPINEDSVLYIDTAPEYDGQGNVTNSHDYIVQRIAPALNHVKIIARKVKVS